MKHLDHNTKEDILNMSGGFGVGTNAFAETAQFIHVQFVPDLVKLGVLAELTVL